MKIAFFDIKDEEKEFFEKQLKKYNAETVFYKESINEIVKESFDFDAVSVFIYSKINDEILNKLPNLKYIQTRSTGYDHIDLVKCYEKNIYVSNVKGYAGPAVGEFSFGLLLEALRKIYIAIHRLQNGDMNYKDLKGAEIEGKTAGILGLGTIGLQMAKIAKGFGANTIGLVRKDKDIYKQLSIKTTPVLEEVLLNSDFLFIALPLTPKTENLINTDNIQKFKGNIIINTARAEIIQKEVYENFPGIIAADVLPEWNLAKKNNIIATPHMAYYTVEALKRIMQYSFDNLEDYLNGRVPRFCLKEECKKNYYACKEK